jgi:hypothetical protein
MPHRLQHRFPVAMVMMRRHVLNKATLESIYFSFDKLKQINSFIIIIINIIIADKLDLLGPWPFLENSSCLHLVFIYLVFSTFVILQIEIISLASYPQAADHISVPMSTSYTPRRIGFLFLRLLQLTGLRWRYSNPLVSRE